MAKPKIQRLNHDGMEAYVFRCPSGACGDHMVPVSHKPEYAAACKEAGRDTPNWNWNHSLEFPTFSPSLLVTWEFTREEHGIAEKHVCHSYITDGKIIFLSDCTHRLAGQTVELEEINLTVPTGHSS